jgi:hypothetical protein
MLTIELLKITRVVFDLLTMCLQARQGSPLVKFHVLLDFKPNIAEV